MSIFDVPPADPREDKLPVWVRDLLRQTRNAAAEAERLAQAARKDTAPDTAMITYENSLQGGRDIGVPDRANVTFWLDGGRQRSIEAGLSADHKTLRLRGSNGLIIEPEVSNGVRVGVRRS